MWLFSGLGQFLSLDGEQGPQEGPAASASVSTKLCDWKKSICIMGLDDIVIFSHFASWYIFRGLCCQSFSIWFLLQLGVFPMQNCRKANTTESQILVFQHIWEAILGMKMSTSCRVVGSLAEVLLSFFLMLCPYVEFRVLLYQGSFLLHISDYSVQ